MVTLRGPRVLQKPEIVYQGESFKLQVPVKDGVRTAAKPFGAATDISAGTKKGILRINKPDDATDVTRDTSVGGEGAKSDPDTEGFDNAFEFYVADTVTTGWSVGVHDFEVEYQDTAPTPDDIDLVLIGVVEVRAKPSAT